MAVFWHMTSQLKSVYATPYQETVQAQLDSEEKQSLSLILRCTGKYYN